MEVELTGLPEFKRQLSYLEKTAFPKAATRAVNRVARTVRSRTIKSVSKHMGTRQKDVRRRMRLFTARRSENPRALLRVKGKALNLIAYKARQVVSGVSAAPWGRRRIFPMAFITEINGTKLVMVRRKRRGKRVGRLPIRPVLGPGVAKSAARPEMRKERAKVVKDRMKIELETALEFYVSRLPG